MAKSLEERFWAKVNKNGPTQAHMETPCWEWVGAVSEGYGSIGMGSRSKGTKSAHRVSYHLAYGEYEGCVLHRCDNRLCVRPDHLELGDKTANNRDAYKRGRIKHSTLTADVVKEMRERHRLGEKATTLSEAYGVSLSAACRAINYQTWRHVE
jgi:hypothetical protein